MARSKIDPKLVADNEECKGNNRLARGLIRLVSRQLAETVLATTTERQLKEHPLEDIVISKISDEEFREFGDVHPEILSFAHEISGKTIPALTKQEALEEAKKDVDFIRRDIVAIWMHMLYRPKQHDERKEILRLTEDLLPEEVDVNTYEQDRPNATDPREALKYFLGQHLYGDDAVSLYVAFATKVRSRIKRHGEMQVMSNIVIGRDADGYYAKRTLR